MASFLIGKDFYLAFGKLLKALQVINNDIVVIGGFANALYEHFDEAAASPLGTIATKDMDILISDKLTHISEDIVKLLEVEGFVLDSKPIQNKTITKFILKETNFEIEFLCPMYGSDPDRNGNKQLVKEIQKGLTAQPLRFLDLALYNTWKINTQHIPELNHLNIDIQVPSPGAYLIQKFIIRERRRANNPAYMQKDCFYTYEILLKFIDNLDGLVKSVNEVVLYNEIKGKRYNDVKNFIRDFKSFYSGPSSDGIDLIFQELKLMGISDYEKEDINAVFEMFFEALEN
jgi:hypothetical protein